MHLLLAVLLALAAPRPAAGEKACSFASHPFITSFYIGRSKYSFCGGSLVHRHWAVSAAHCFVRFRRADHQFVRAESGVGEPASRFALAVYAHPLYDGRTLANDIALVRLAAPFPADWPYVPVGGRGFSDDSYAMTIVTWAQSQTPAEKRGGRKYLTGTGLPRLTCLRVKRIDRTICSMYVFAGVSLNVSLICATSNEKGTHPCPGDSGGPLLSDDVLVGVTSFGLPCRVKGSPSAFTEVAAHLEWIAKVLRPRGCWLSTLSYNNDSNILYVLGAAAAVGGNLLGVGFVGMLVAIVMI